MIGFIGRFVPEKGVLDLIRAAGRLRGDFTLLLIGGGALEDEMRRLAAEVGVADRLRIVRSIPHADIPRHINCMDMLVLPSYTVPHWKEQFGQVLVQAMASEVPVLGSTHAEIPRVIGDAGLTFEERNTEQLLERMQQLLDSATLRAEFAEKGGVACSNTTPTLVSPTALTKCTGASRLRRIHGKFADRAIHLDFGRLSRYF